MKLHPVQGNRQRLDGGAMFGNVPRPMWTQWMPPDEQGRIELSCRCLLLQVEGQNILFETGIGNFFEPRMAERFGVQDPHRHILTENLAHLGVSPEQIDWVVLSHLHFDHAGGLLPSFESRQRGERGLQFPRAKILVGQEAWERALKPHSRDRASFVPELIENLKAGEQLVIHRPGEKSKDLPENLDFFFTHGHTPGQMHARIRYGNDLYVFAGDLIPGAPWVHLPITMGYDRYPELLIDEKAQLYKSDPEKALWLFFTHDPKWAWGRVGQNEKGHYVALDLKAEETLQLS